VDTSVLEDGAGGVWRPPSSSPPITPHMEGVLDSLEQEPQCIPGAIEFISNATAVQGSRPTLAKLKKFELFQVFERRSGDSEPAVDWIELLDEGWRCC